ncbi:hypothetical protein [Candidatus Frankia nodulisporulans]|uniref:hypothetical protein n=1 Tax=Candidatus Frankia nodulisporulans TaxID=2060052 RepID=UPI0013D52553|nr:hypothetical protein [Candidatus Frankia nodulisporulans]
MSDLETLTFRRPDGDKAVWEVEMDPGPPEETRNFRTRRGLYQNFPIAIRYAIGGENAELPLENAIATGLRMLRRFDADRHFPWERGATYYPWQLSRLFGYEVDRDEPFAITAEYGAPIEQLTSPLVSPDDLGKFAGGLILLEQLGISHRQLRGNTLHWDPTSRTLQINRFEYARRLGEPRSRLAQVPTPADRTPREWASPEQILGRGFIDAGDDLYAAGCALLSVVTPGGLHIGLGGRPDVAASGMPWLGQILHGVFDAPDARPTATELLRRLGQIMGADEVPRHEPDTLAEGRRAYDQLMAAKGQPAPARPARPSSPPPNEPPGGHPPFASGPDDPTGPRAAPGQDGYPTPHTMTGPGASTDPETLTRPPSPHGGSTSSTRPEKRRRRGRR